MLFAFDKTEMKQWTEMKLPSVCHQNKQSFITFDSAKKINTQINLTFSNVTKFEFLSFVCSFSTCLSFALWHFSQITS